MPSYRKNHRNLEARSKNTRHSKEVLNEVFGILLLALSIFILLSCFYPETTGIIGYYVVEIFIRRFFGLGVFILPVFIAVLGLALLIRKNYSHISRRLLGFILASLSFVTLAELIVRGKIEKLIFPIKYNGGGIIGYVFSFSLQKVIGIIGSKLILFTFLMVSFILLFNVTLASILRIFKWLLVKIFLLERKEKYVNRKSIIDRKREEFYKNNKSKNSITAFLKGILGLNEVKTVTKETERKDILSKKDPREEAKEKFYRERRERLLEEIKERKPYILTEKGLKKVEHKTKMPTASSDDDNYKLPPFDLLKPAILRHGRDRQKIIERESLILEETLASFGVEARVVSVSQGPAVTRYELQPAPGVKVSKITNLANDIALQLAAQAVRIEAPIPGKAMVGIEVPNADVDIVNLSAIIKNTDFYEKPSKLLAGLGLTLAGEPVLIDLPKMPHVLIAGATGSGKSVCINSVITSFLMKAKPSEVKFLMIDPKKVEFSIYENIPHLLAPVVTDPRKAAATLKQWAIKEMDRRYEEFSRMGVRNIEGYNKLVEDMDEEDIQKMMDKPRTENYTDPYNEKEEPSFIPKKLPYIVVIID